MDSIRLIRPITQRLPSPPGPHPSNITEGTDRSNYSSQTIAMQDMTSSSSHSEQDAHLDSASELNRSSNEIENRPGSLTEVTVDRRTSTYFEVCTNIGN
jgi:hypothetical protein